jgi:hypothetical protein
MLIGAEGGGLPVEAQVLGWIFGLIIFAGACIGGYYLFRGRQASADMAMADSAVTSLTGELAASNSRIDRLETDNKHLQEINSQQKILNESLSSQLQDLREWVTARDLIDALDAKVERGFMEMGVPQEKLRMVR